MRNIVLVTFFLLSGCHPQPPPVVIQPPSQEQLKEADDRAAESFQAAFALWHRKFKAELCRP